MHAIVDREVDLPQTLGRCVGEGGWAARDPLPSRPEHPVDLPDDRGGRRDVQQAVCHGAIHAAVDQRQTECVEAAGQDVAARCAVERRPFAREPQHALRDVARDPGARGQRSGHGEVTVAAAEVEEHPVVDGFGRPAGLDDDPGRTAPCGRIRCGHAVVADLPWAFGPGEVDVRVVGQLVDPVDDREGVPTVGTGRQARGRSATAAHEHGPNYLQGMARGAASGAVPRRSGPRGRYAPSVHPPHGPATGPTRPPLARWCPPSGSVPPSVTGRRSTLPGTRRRPECRAW